MPHYGRSFPATAQLPPCEEGRCLTDPPRRPIVIAMTRNHQDIAPPAPRSTSPVIRRGKHEDFIDYWDRIVVRSQPGRHEAPTHNKLVAAYAPTDPEGIARMEADVRGALGPAKITGEWSGFSSTPSQARITRYEHMSGRRVVEGPHPSWPNNPCPYPDGHKPGCSWWTGVAWVTTGINLPDKIGT